MKNLKKYVEENNIQEEVRIKKIKCNLIFFYDMSF